MGTLTSKPYAMMNRPVPRHGTTSTEPPDTPHDLRSSPANSTRIILKVNASRPRDDALTSQRGAALYLAGHKVREKESQKNLSQTRPSATGQKEPVRQMSARNLVHLLRLCCCFIAIRFKVTFVSPARKS